MPGMALGKEVDMGTEPETPREFSQAAKASVEGGITAEHKRLVLSAIRLYGPLNTDEIEEKTGIVHQSASPVVLALRREGRLVQTGKRPTRSDRMAAVWGIAEPGQAGTQAPAPASVSVAPAASGGTSEGMFETIEEPNKPALRASDYVCGRVLTVKGKRVPCLTRLTHIDETLFEERYVRGYCPSCKQRVDGSLSREKASPVGWGSRGRPASQTTKPKAYRKRKKA